MSLVLDESIVGQWYIPHTNAYAQCVVGEDNAPALVGTAEVCPEIFKIHSPAFSLPVWVDDIFKGGTNRLLLTKRFVYLQARNQNIYLALFDSDNVFNNWNRALKYRDDFWTELKYQAATAPSTTPAFGRLDRAA